MNHPLNPQTPTDVELLCLTPDGPVMFMGRARTVEEDEIEVNLNGPANRTIAGSQAIISFPTSSDAPRITAKVLSTDGNRIALSCPQLRPRDKRLFPRLYGNIPLRYQVHNPEDGELVIHRWLAGSTRDLVPRPWFSPEPFMNFSVNGLSFEAEQGCKMGDVLLLHMGVGESTERWRATGKVVRMKEVTVDDKPMFEIAIAFETLPDNAMEALSDFTLSIQEALL